MEHDADGDISCNWCSWNNLQRTVEWTGRLGNMRTSGDHPNNCISKIVKTTMLEVTCCNSNFCEKLSVYADEKKISQILTIILKPDNDDIHGFWLKKITLVRDRLAIEMNRRLKETNIPE